MKQETGNAWRVACDDIPEWRGQSPTFQSPTFQSPTFHIPLLPNELMMHSGDAIGNDLKFVQLRSTAGTGESGEVSIEGVIRPRGDFNGNNDGVDFALFRGTGYRLGKS